MKKTAAKNSFSAAKMPMAKKSMPMKMTGAMASKIRTKANKMMGGKNAGC